jgi:PAS domain S-box-containing protein
MTEEQRATSVSADERDALRMVLDYMPGGVALVDPELSYIVFNEKYAELFEFPDGIVARGRSAVDEFRFQAERGDFGNGEKEELIQQVIDKYRSREDISYERHLPDGATLEIRIAPTPDDGTVVVVNDITERKRAEEALAASEAQFRDTLESSPIGTTIVRADGSFSFVNSRMAEMVGLSKKQFLASRARDFYVDPTARDAINDRLLHAGRLRDVEACMKKPDGTPFWVLLSFEPAHYQGEQSYFGWVYDITERKRAQEESTKQSRIIRNTLETIDHGILMVDANMTIVTYNQLFAEMFGVPRSLLDEQGNFHDLIRQWLERAGMDDRVKEKAIENTNRRDFFKFEQTLPDGRIIEVRHLPRDDGWFVRTFDDISERKQVEEQRERQSLQAHLLHSAAEMAAETDSIEEALQHALDMICEMTHWSVGHVYRPSDTNDEVLVSTIIWHFDDADRFETFREITEQTSFSVGEGLPGRILQSGAPVWITNVQSDSNFPRNKIGRDLGVKGAFGFPVNIGGKTVAVLEFFAREEMAPDENFLEIMRNVGEQLGRVFERKQAEVELRRAKEKAERALADLTRAQQDLVQSEKMASLGQLTAGIAHEIKNPLNFVNNFAETSVELLEELGEILNPVAETLDEKTRDDINDLLKTLESDLQTIATHGHRADGIMRSMLMHAREHTGELEASDLNALVEQSLKLAYHGERSHHAQFNVTMETMLGDDVGMVHVMPQELTRVLVNVFGNCFYAVRNRAGESDAKDYEPTVRVTTKSLGGDVEVCIWDNGTGMPAEVVEKLFTPFFTTKPAGQGTGLGLSLSYDIVVQGHGGSVDVTSENGEFTEFVLRLPRTPKHGAVA